jgi:hypothetical protein
VKKPSYRTLAARNRTQADRIDELIEQRDDAVKGEQACASQLERIAHENNLLRDEVALTIVACKHPSSALSDAHSVAIALQEALTARGIDLRVELARLEGSDL